MQINEVDKGWGSHSLSKMLRIMKLFTAFMLLFLVHASARTFAQKVTLDLDNVGLSKVFREIRKQTGLNFFYRSEVLKKAGKVSINVHNTDVQEVLAKCLTNKPVDFKIINGTIIISEKTVVLVSDTYQAPLPDFEVSGTVTDQEGKPLEGVSVKLKGTSRGVSTDASGKFRLQVPDRGGVLEISYIGYEATELHVSKAESFTIQLKVKVETTDSVVVIGYGTQKKVDVSGAVKQASGEVLENRPIANLGAGLQGVIPNLTITNGGAPGAGANFNVRGYTSINGGSPLILVDGVVEDPNLINPNDVASVTVLEDAASAAIYGARAAYGVILITTKSGKKNQPVTINISSSYAINNVTRRPKYMNSLDYINYMDTASINDGGGTYFSQRIRDGVVAHFNDPSKPSVLYDPSIDVDGKYIYVGNTDWASALYQAGSLQQNNISISAGSQSTSYYLSYGNSKQTGFLSSYNDYYYRHNLTANVTSDIAKWLTVTGKVRYTFSTEDHPAGGVGGSYNNSGLSPYGGQLKGDLRPIMPITHPDGNWAGQGNFTNPFAIGAEGGYNRYKINDLWLTGAITVRPVKDVNLNLDYSFNPYFRNATGVEQQFREYHADG
ncbi:MAG TPA: SusC/RagA family TonB-linked outer membrane protein, partial [Flavisolibacter sp.]|nr:SusC/RagA family TonB-linked outer membrane protein [Flavisolibacter sp.]